MPLPATLTQVLVQKWEPSTFAPALSDVLQAAWVVYAGNVLARQSGRDMIDVSMIIVPSDLMPVTQKPLSAGSAQPPAPSGTALSPTYFARASLAVKRIGIIETIKTATYNSLVLVFIFALHELQLITLRPGRWPHAPLVKSAK
jgi:hypothetical protein